jgi:hypothetical protein
MNKSDPPTTFGVFKPTGHTLIAFHSHNELCKAMAALSKLGFYPDTMVQYTAEEMRLQAEAELKEASPMANFGYEIDLVRKHKELAEQGCSFLIVHAPEDEKADLISSMLRSMKPASAQHYGLFLIQDLTEKPLGQTAKIN